MTLEQIEESIREVERLLAKYKKKPAIILLHLIELRQAQIKLLEAAYYDRPSQANSV